MGSVMHEPDDIAAYMSQAADVKNFSTVCISAAKMHSAGLFHHSNPLNFSVPLLLLQFSLASGTILLTSRLLKPLCQPLMVAQIFGGIILGPSFLGRNVSLTTTIFPPRGFIMLDIISSFGYIFYFFLIGLQMDPWILKKIDRNTFGIGFSTVALPMITSTAMSFIIMHFVSMESKISNSLPLVAQAESALAFPVIAHFLSELKIINSEFGRLAMSSSMVSGLCSFCVITTSVLMHEPASNNYRSLTTIGVAIGFGAAIVFVVRPAILWMIRQNPSGEPLKQDYLLVLLIGILSTSFFCQATGLHIYYGALVLGITMPAGPPIGSALVEKLELITYWILMPLYFVKNGLVINIFAVKPKHYFIIQFIALSAAIGKFLGAFLSSLYCQMPTRDAVSLGLVMTAQGVVELGLFKMLKNNKAIDSETYMVMCTSLLIVTGCVTPMIKYLYDPSRRYVVYKRRTVMHSRPNSELRVLVCIHDEEYVPATINLLEALHPNRGSPLGVYVLHLIELVGRANPLLIPHMLSKRPSKKASPSERIVSSFRYFEQRSYGLVSLYPFTAISPPKTMHDDVCSIALDKRTSLVIVPFYKRFTGSGTMELSIKAIKIMNNNVLHKAPCSIAILVDRGLLKTTRHILGSWPCYHVAVLFVGGADDREALALGARMAGHPNINLTIIRLLENGLITGDSSNGEERRLDNEVLSDFRLATAGNFRVVYAEEVVIDGSGTVAVIRSLEANYEMVIVGRHHDNESPLVSGLTDWNEHKELGAIGDVLASSEFMGNTTILVVQQHKNVADVGHENQRENFREQNMSQRQEEAEDIPMQRTFMRR